MTFDPDKDIPDLSGKVILVTGGNIGLGRETILQLSKHSPAHIYLAARSKAKAEAAIEQIKQSLPKGKPPAITFLELDLSSFASVKTAAETFKSSSPRLDLLFNNAGIMATPPGLTKEGYEIQFGTNHMGHALLTNLLLPTLKNTASSTTPPRDVRVITVSSAAHKWTPRQGYCLSQAKTDMSSTSPWTKYGISKLANIHYSHSLATRHPEIKFVALHPGSVNTNLVSGPASSYPYFSWLINGLKYIVTGSVEKGALNQLWAATAPSQEVKTGLMYYPVGVEGKENALARDERIERELWDWTEKELEGHI